MRLKIVRETDYLRVDLQGRETPEETRKAISTILAQCRRHGVSSVLVRTRASRPLFKVQEFGLSAVLAGMSPGCRVALVADNHELRAADDYIATMAQQQHVNVRSFRTETVAVRWLRSTPEPSKRYKFHRIVLAGAPNEPGVYALWQDEELVYYGRALGGNGVSIRSRLMEHYEAGADVTHYSWEISRAPASREQELLREYVETFGRLPRLNDSAAA